MSRDLGLDNQVDFVGATPPARLAEIYNGHKIAVVPSICDEGFGLVALEAIACGCAVVGSGSGGLPEAIGPCGLIYPKTSISDLASCLEQLITRPWLCKALQHHAKDHLARHTRAAVAASYLSFIAASFPALAFAAHSLPNHVAGDVELSGPVELPVRRTIGRRTTAESLRAHG
jgi:glycogen synthase